MSNIALSSGNSILTLSKETGAISGLSYHGTETICPANEAFSLRFLNEENDYVNIGSSDFTSVEVTQDQSSCTFYYSQGKTVPGLKVKVNVKSGLDGYRFNPSVIDIPKGLRLELLDCPHVVVKMDDELFIPQSEGCIVDYTSKKERGFEQLDFPDNCGLGYYPGVCQMQFMAAYSSEYGVYLSADDYSHSTKILEYSSEGEHRLRLRIENCCGSDSLDQSKFELPFDIVIRNFQGDWMDACSIYREWVKHDPALKRNFTLPSWMDESPVVIVYPVRGSGTIKDEPNRFMPYDAAYPVIEKLSAEFDSKVMALLMRWDQYGPWHPPYYWPPFGGLDPFLKFRDMLHESGNLLGIYGSGTAYTLKSKVNDYSSEKEYAENDLQRYMCQGRKGETTAMICDMIREGCEICIAEEWGRNALIDQVEKAAEAGVDYYQFFDQNLGCASFQCYSKDHSHPSVPGQWQTQAMQKLIDDMNDVIRKNGSEMILGTECAAAGPYVAGLPFNDLRDQFTIHRGTPVPGFQFVYHAFANNFFGNQCEIWQRINCPESPDNLLFRIAKGFSAGEYLTVTLRDSGEIDWGAAADWEQAAPEQAPLCKLIRNLNTMRKKYPEFLQHGEMQKPFCHIECGSYTMPFKKGDVDYPEIIQSSWTSPDGKKVQFLVNFQNKPKRLTVFPLNGIQAESNGNIFSGDPGYELTIPPLSCEVLFL